MKKSLIGVVCLSFICLVMASCRHDDVYYDIQEDSYQREKWVGTYVFTKQESEYNYSPPPSPGKDGEKSSHYGFPDTIRMQKDLYANYKLMMRCNDVIRRLTMIHPSLVPSGTPNVKGWIGSNEFYCLLTDDTLGIHYKDFGINITQTYHVYYKKISQNPYFKGKK